VLRRRPLVASGNRRAGAETSSRNDIVALWPGFCIRT